MSGQDPSLSIEKKEREISSKRKKKRKGPRFRERGNLHLFQGGGGGKRKKNPNHKKGSAGNSPFLGREEESLLPEKEKEFTKKGDFPFLQKEKGEGGGGGG